MASVPSQYKRFEADPWPVLLMEVAMGLAILYGLFLMVRMYRWYQVETDTLDQRQSLVSLCNTMFAYTLVQSVLLSIQSYYLEVDILDYLKK